MTKSERDLFTMVPNLEACAIFFILLHHSSNFFARRLHVLRPGEDLVEGARQQAHLVEIMASTLIIMFHGVFHLYPGNRTITDYVLVGLGAWVLIFNVYRLVRHQGAP